MKDEYLRVLKKNLIPYREHSHVSFRGLGSLQSAWLGKEVISSKEAIVQSARQTLMDTEYIPLNFFI